jgi:hypothetical protein
VFAASGIAMFRYFLLISAAILGGLIMYHFGNWDQISNEFPKQQRSKEWPQQEKARYEETTAISTNDLSFSRVALNHALDRPKWWALEGSVTNNSTHELKSIVFQVTLRDCEKVGNIDTCHIVGQENAHAVDLKVSPGQTRAFKSSTFEFKNLPKEILASCTKGACGSARQFNWVVWEIRAGS